MSEFIERVFFFAGHMAWHFGVAITLSLLMRWWLGEWKWAIVCFIAALYPDCDHLFEYILVKGFDFDIHTILSGAYFKEIDQRFLWFHAYEMILLVWVWAWFKRRYAFATAFSFGLASHLLIDQITYPVKPLAYSIIYRWIHHFDVHAFGVWDCP